MALPSDFKVDVKKEQIGGFGFLIKESKGDIVVSNLIEGSCTAMSKNLKVLDCIKSVNKSNCKSLDETRKYLTEVPVGSKVELSIRRPLNNASSRINSENSSLNGDSADSSFLNGDKRNENYIQKSNRPKKNHNEVHSNGNSTHSNGENGINNGALHDQGAKTSIGCPFTGQTKELQKGGSSSTKKPYVVNNMQDGTQLVDKLHQTASNSVCTTQKCLGSIMFPENVEDKRKPGEMRSKEEVKIQAEDFLRQYYSALNSEKSAAHKTRVEDVMKQIDATGHYNMDEKELIFGVRLAWRNAARCIGRIQWKKIQVFDCRHVTSASQMFECILHHLKFATNKGKIRSTMSVFPHRSSSMKDYRVWNSQLIRYAGYKQADGSVIGDPGNVEFTEICQQLGWVGKGEGFEVLPLVLQANGEAPELFEIPKEYVQEVDITHPEYPSLASLGLKWYTVPAVSCLNLDCGGLEFTAAPFNGWYMATEIGARNFADANRYNLLEPVAKLLNLNTSSNMSMWKDKAIIALTEAVLHSFNKEGVTITDHHSASQSFMKHYKDEFKLRGGCPADWVWVVPPISGAATGVFHQEMLNYKLRPSYEYQTDPWKYFSIKKNTASPSESIKKKKNFKEIIKAVNISTKLMGGLLAKREKTTIIYATETGNSETYANLLNELFLHAFDSEVICMSDYEFCNFTNEQCVLIVASTFGNGEAPDNGQAFANNIEELCGAKLNPNERKPSTTSISSEVLASLRYSVFALGSRAYPNFCAFGKLLDHQIRNLGGEQIFELGEGDELNGQELTFKRWALGVFKAACDIFCVSDVKLNQSLKTRFQLTNMGHEKQVKIESSNGHAKDAVNKTTALSGAHHKEVSLVNVICAENLQSKESGRVTNLIRFDLQNTNMSYHPGDHLCIHPSNNQKLVEQLLNMVKSTCKLDDQVKVLQKMEGSDTKWEPKKNIPYPTSLREVFSLFLDITSPPAPHMLSLLAEECTDKIQKEKLLLLSTYTEAYEEWKFNKYPNMVEVLREFGSINIDVAFLIDLLPALKPRFYSISSSQELYPNEVHITVAKVEYETNEGAKHVGVCSTWLDGLQTGDKVPCSIKNAPKFHLPKDKTIPIIMIGPGTGIAPFRSFWQQLEHEALKSNEVQRKAVLFFGCRNSKLDNIYQTEKETAVQDKVLNKVFNAFSREDRKAKVYVQDLLKTNAELVGDTLVSEEGHLYICGDVGMATEVNKTIEEILRDYTAYSPDEVNDYIKKMKHDGRYHEDIFGVTLKHEVVSKKIRTAVSRQARHQNWKKQLSIQ